jgi:hypothetical protein
MEYLHNTNNVWCWQQPQVPFARNIINPNEHLKFNARRDQKKFQLKKYACID